jgi:hypothetical protein
MIYVLLILVLLCGCVYVGANGTYIKRQRYIQDGTNTVNKLLHFDFDFDP